MVYKMGRIFPTGMTLIVELFVVLLAFWEHVHGVPIQPQPGVLPGQIPPHLATHPALSSTVNGKESQLLQFAYNTQNRRGPQPSNLVLQNNQERNLGFANQVQQQRSGRPFLPSSGQGLSQGQDHQHQHGSENPELRALELLQKYKGGGDQGQGQQSSYNNPGPLTHQHGHTNFPPSSGQSGYPQNGHSHSHSGFPPQGAPPGAGSNFGQDNESEDIRRLKSLLNQGQGSPTSSYGSGVGGGGHGSPNIGLTSQRGIINPSQYPPQQHSHDHSHHDHGHGQPQQQYPGPTPFPATAQSQKSLGTLQFGQTPRSYGYPGSGGPTGSPGQGVQVPYGGSQYPHSHDHSQHHHGQDARTLIQNHASPSENYQPLVYVDPVREPNSINRHIQPSQSVFVLPASDYKSDDFQRLLNRPAEILIDVVPVDGREPGSDISVHNFSLLLTPSTYARCAQATHSKGYGGKCKLILKAGKRSSPFSSGGSPQPVTVSYKK